MNNNGRILILSGPSGSGKSSLLKYLLANFDNTTVSVSVTTREPRQNEVHGVDYEFISKDEFQKLIDNDELLEYEEVHGNFYGTKKETIDIALNFGEIVIFDIDTRGKKSLEKFYKDIMISVFITTPTKETLEERLRLRDSETEEKIQQRLSNAKYEMENLPSYDFVIINDSLEKAQNHILKIANLLPLRPSKEFTKELIEIWAL